MELPYFTMYFHIAIVLAFLHAVSCQETLFGVVSLSLSPLTSVSVNQDGGFVNVSLLLYDSTTNMPSINSTAFIDEDVVVMCSIITPYENGDSRVVFVDDVIPSFAESGTIEFSIEEQGRTVEIQCSGETSPDNTGTTSYFSFDTSAGPTGFLVVKKSPVVSFCEPIIFVPISSGVTSSAVQVELSEPVVDYQVTVSCDIIGVIDANNSLWLDFQDTIVEPGSRTDVIISYDIQKLGDIVQVACYGVSEQGSQYLQNTSQGEPAIFQRETSSVTLIPSVSSITNPSINVFLVLGSVLTPGEGTITYACYVDPVVSYEEGLELAANPTCETPDDVFRRPTPAPAVTTVTAATNTTTDNTTNPMTTPTTPPVQTTPTTPPATTSTQPPATTTPASSGRSNETQWQLVESEIAFEEGDIFKELTLNLDPDTPTFDGAILVSCCAPQDINSNTKYINTSTALVFYATVQAPRAINWTSATGLANRFIESAILNPAYVDLSPCPCDLTSGHCDADCCCDEDCDAADILVFTCADDTEEYPVTIYDCNSTDLYKPDWSPLLCVQTSNTPYLGLYQSTVSAIRDITTFNAAKEDSLTSRGSSYQDSGLRSLEYQSPDNSQYSNGDPVELLYDEETRGFLALPQMTLSGECLWTSPVKFQEDLTTHCTLMPDQRLCQQFSPFSALMFLRSSTESYPPCPKEPKVASQYGQATEAPTDVEYYCLEDVSDYLSEETVDRDLFGLYDSSLFAEFQNDTSEEMIPKRCSWDDGYTQPPIPLYDNDTKLCSDSVVSASYEMFWRGGEIVSIKGVVILGAVPLIQDLSIGIDEEEEFVSPPPATEAPVTTQPTTEPLLTSLMTDSMNSVTIITDVTEVFETAFTDLTMATDNMTMFMFEEDFNVTTAQQSTGTTPAGTTLQGTTSSTTQSVLTPHTTPPVTTSELMTSPDVTTDAPSNMTTSMSNGTMGINNINVTADMTTEAPVTTAAPFIVINTMPLNITLRFSTTFTYLPETPIDPLTGQNMDLPEAFERSGNPGYIIGKPLLTGLVVQTPLVLPTDPGPPVNCTEFPSSPSCIEIPENETVYVFDSVDTSPSNQLQIFSPGDGSLCARSSTSTLTFGEDIVSGCILRMGQSELQNCSVLAAYMEEQLRALVPADRIGKRGNSSVIVEEDWAEVFNPDEHPFDPPTTMPPTTEAPMETTADPLTTRFPGQRYIDPESPIQAVEQLTSRCSDIPTSMNLEVLIAEAGVYNGVMQYEVLAARVLYSTSTVTLTCSGALGASCYLEDRPIVSDPAGNGTIVQSFPVYSTVTYTTVPAVEPEPVILYYKDYDPDLCKQDICLSELFYPITGGFDGDTYQYSVAVSLMLVIITTAYFIVTSPWAHL